MSCSWFIAVIDLLVEHTTEHKCAQDMALHTTELALHTTGPICFDSLACLQIAFLTFDYSLQLLVLPNVFLTTTENNALTTIVPVTHLNARNPLVLVPNRRVHAPPFCLQLARLCAAQCTVVCSSTRLCGGSPVNMLHNREANGNNVIGQMVCTCYLVNDTVEIAITCKISQKIVLFPNATIKNKTLRTNR